jgi:hypothetical protein
VGLFVEVVPVRLIQWFSSSIKRETFVGPIIMRDSERASFIAGEGPSLLVAAEIKHTKHNKQHQKLDDGWHASETVP